MQNYEKSLKKKEVMRKAETKAAKFRNQILGKREEYYLDSINL